MVSFSRRSPVIGATGRTRSRLLSPSGIVPPSSRAWLVRFGPSSSIRSSTKLPLALDRRATKENDTSIGSRMQAHLRAGHEHQHPSRLRLQGAALHGPVNDVGGAFVVFAG